VATELTLALDAADPESPDYALLEDAELQLLTRCRGLNQLANERRDGEPVGGLGALQRARQAPDCELATRDAVALLERS
jgi:hypothetical protein